MQIFVNTLLKFQNFDMAVSIYYIIDKISLILLPEVSYGKNRGYYENILLFTEDQVKKMLL